MAKSNKKKGRVEHVAGEPAKTARRMTKIRDCVGYLSELHKLQGTLLNRLRKEVGERRARGGRSGTQGA